MMENKTKIDLKNKSVFITGVAGFIGSNLAKRLRFENFSFVNGNLADKAVIKSIFEQY